MGEILCLMEQERTGSEYFLDQYTGQTTRGFFAPEENTLVGPTRASNLKQR
jgi:hypothetical protein